MTQLMRAGGPFTVKLMPVVTAHLKLCVCSWHHKAAALHGSYPTLDGFVLLPKWPQEKTVDEPADGKVYFSLT